MRKLLLLLAALTCCAQAGWAQAGGEESSLLWRVDGPELSAPSYLYGTMHVQRKPIFEFNRVVLDKIRETDVFVGELDYSDKSIQGKMMRAFVMPGDTTLFMLISKEDSALVADVFQKKTGQPLALFQRMHPMFTSLTIDMVDMVGSDTPQPLDMFLASYAEKHGKKIAGLETLDEQVSALTSMPLQRQAEHLVEGVKVQTEDPDTLKRMFDKMTRLYRDGKLQELSELLNEYGEAGAEMEDDLLTKRNKLMAERLEPMMKEQAVFAAIGAAHLGGEEGVVKLLEAKGYTLTPIPFEFDGSGWYLHQKEENPDPADNWFAHDDDAYSIKFPDQPETRKQRLELIDASAVSLLAHTRDNQTGRSFSARSLSLPARADTSAALAVLRKLVIDEAQQHGAQVTGDNLTRIQYKGLYGFLAQTTFGPNYQLRLRFLTDGQMIYGQTVGHAGDYEDGPRETAAFFDSFEPKR